MHEMPAAVFVHTGVAEPALQLFLRQTRPTTDCNHNHGRSLLVFFSIGVQRQAKAVQMFAMSLQLAWSMSVHSIMMISEDLEV